MDEIYLVIPRWFYPTNLGDSIAWSMAPAVLKKEYPESKLTVITHGELLQVMDDNPFVDQVANPTQLTPTPEWLNGSYEFWRDHSKTSSEYLPDNVFVLFAEWHPKLWKFWNENFDFLHKHPTANLVYVNILIQLGLEKYVFEEVDLFPKIYIDQPKVEEKTLGIVPAHKKSYANPNPHMGCDGKGLRFNGDAGESWEAFVEEIRRLVPDIKIMEFSKKHLGFGDVHIGHMPWKALAVEACKPKVSVLADGGMHHMFNSQDRDIVLIAAQTINKLTHYGSKNTKLYWDLHSKCMSRCGEQIRKLNGWEGLTEVCDHSCETVDPIKLAQYVYRDFFEEKV